MPSPTSKNEPLRFLVSDFYGGMRLDRFALKVSGLPKNALARMIRTGTVRLNSKKSTAAYRVEPGDELEIFLAKGESLPADASSPAREGKGNASPSKPGVSPARNYDICMVYEDRHIAVADKPAGMLSQPSKGSVAGESLSEFFMARNAKESQDPHFRAGVLWRLDRNVSGLVASAKNPISARFYSQAVRDKTLEKTYYALVCGRPAGRWIKESHAIKSGTSNRMSPADKGGEGSVGMQGEYSLVESSGSLGISLVAVRLITGKTHQIRFQMAEVGNPVLGDGKYGTGESMAISRRLGIGRVMLHCASVTLPDPNGGPARVVSGDLPKDFLQAMRKAGINERKGS